MIEVHIRQAVDRAAAIARLTPVARHATDGATVVDICAGCELLDVFEGGQVIGSMAIEIEGDRATIKAAAGHGQMTGTELRLVELMLARRGVRTVGLFTRRPALVRRLLGAGYELAQAEMVKGIA